MYLNPGYFPELGPSPADDIGQGYLTETLPADHVSPAILEVAMEYPELLEAFKPDPDLMKELEQEPDNETFRLYRNDEHSFDGITDTGYMGYGLDIAFSEHRRFALVAYTGPGLPTIIRRYNCTSAEEAGILWGEEWAAPLIYAMFADNDNAVNFGT